MVVQTITAPIDAVINLINWIVSLVNWIKTAVEGLGVLNWFKGSGSGAPEGYVARYASGGFPEDGLFMANHGELVGKFSNGRTAVANNEEIIRGIEQGVFNAVTSAMSSQGNGDIRIYLDGKQIANTVTRNQMNLSRATGVAY